MKKNVRLKKGDSWRPSPTTIYVFFPPAQKCEAGETYASQSGQVCCLSKRQQLSLTVQFTWNVACKCSWSRANPQANPLDMSSCTANPLSRLSHQWLFGEPRVVVSALYVRTHSRPWYIFHNYVCDLCLWCPNKSIFPLKVIVSAHSLWLHRLFVYLFYLLTFFFIPKDY